ncbi:MAG TPA: hypothetical protein VNJ87_00010 [Candidatus Macondimonas sp.]|nr:hypothetical protein [Candidatus Macondimonas sp.]
MEYIGNKRDTLLGAGPDGGDVEVWLGARLEGLDPEHPEVRRALRVGSLTALEAGRSPGRHAAVLEAIPPVQGGRAQKEKEVDGA